MMRWWRWENKSKVIFRVVKNSTNVRERRGRRSDCWGRKGRESMWGEGWGWEEGAGCGQGGVGRQIRKLRQRSSTSNKGWGLSRSGRRRAPVSSFPADHLPPLAGCWGCSLAPGPASRAPGSTDQHASRMDPKDGQCSLPPSRLIILFSNSPRYIFPSAQPSSARLVSGPSFPSSRPVQTISLGSKEVGVQVAFLCCWFPAEHGPLLLLVLRTAHVRPPLAPSMIGLAHHTLCSLPLPTVLLVRSWPTGAFAAPPCSSSSLFHYLLLLPKPLSLSPYKWLRRSPGECAAAPIMSPWFLVSCTLSRKVTGPGQCNLHCCIKLSVEAKLICARLAICLSHCLAAQSIRRLFSTSLLQACPWEAEIDWDLREQNYSNNLKETIITESYQCQHSAKHEIAIKPQIQYIPKRIYWMEKAVEWGFFGAPSPSPVHMVISKPQVNESITLVIDCSIFSESGPIH